MAAARRGGREPGKSDSTDAIAVARAALREGLAKLPAAQLPADRPGHAREIAEAIAFLAHPGARNTTGSSIIVDGGLMLGAAEFNREVAS